VLIAVTAAQHAVAVSTAFGCPNSRVMTSAAANTAVAERKTFAAPGPEGTVRKPVVATNAQPAIATAALRVVTAVQQTAPAAQAATMRCPTAPVATPVHANAAAATTNVAAHAESRSRPADSTGGEPTEATVRSELAGPGPSIGACDVVSTSSSPS